MSEQPTFVLIHGAWAASWVWDSLRTVLEGQGYAVITPDMPGNSRNPASPEQINMQGCVSHVQACCAGVTGPLLIVGHSGGGVVATQVAEVMAEQVAGIAYIAGMMLPSGLGFAELADEVQKTQPEAAGIWPYLEWSEDRQSSTVPPQAVCDVFLQDLPPELAMAAAQRFCAQPEGTRALVAEWSAERFGQLPRLYIEAQQDKSVVLSVQRRMQQLTPGAKVVSLDTGHVPQVTATQVVADALLSFAR